MNIKHICPVCRNNLPLLPKKKSICLNCKTNLIARNTSALYLVICILGYIPAKLIYLSSLMAETLIKTSLIFISLCVIFVTLNRLFVTYEIDSEYSNKKI